VHEEKKMKQNEGEMRLLEQNYGADGKNMAE